MIMQGPSKCGLPKGPGCAVPWHSTPLESALTIGVFLIMANECFQFSKENLVIPKVDTISEQKQRHREQECINFIQIIIYYGSLIILDWITKLPHKNFHITSIGKSSSSIWLTNMSSIR